MDNAEFLSTMRDRLRMAIDAYADSRDNQLEDKRFAAGDSDNRFQWPQQALATRVSANGNDVEARPCLTFNLIQSHIRLITNDLRQNRPAGKVIPASDDASVDVAAIFEDVVRGVFYFSDADIAIDTAVENMVVSGEGFIRILTEYCDNNSFDQDIRIARVRNPFSVYMDPMIEDPCGSDARWCLITDDMPLEDYEREYPDASPVTALQSLGLGDNNISNWVSQNTVRIAEYFYVETQRKRLNLYPGGMTAYAGDPQDKQLQAMGLLPVRSRDADVKKVWWCKTNGYEVIDGPREWPGKYIPVVRMVGNETEIDGRVYISGLVRTAKDAQRLYNYWRSQEAEMLALAPKAPFIGYDGSFEGYEDQWRQANSRNYPYLQANSTATDGQGNPLPLPQRSMPPMASNGIIEAANSAVEDLKRITGQYNASLGAPSNETSGRAITARERQADTGTFQYVDNAARAVRYVTRQIVDLAPKVMDTARILRGMTEDDESTTIRIDPDQQEPVKVIKDPQTGATVEKIYNLARGEYDVRVVTGPNFATKRQEGVDAMSQILQGNPQLWQVAGDLIVRNMDWPGSEELAERLKKTIDPKLLTDDDDADPALQAAQQQMQAMAQQMEAMHQMLQNVDKSFEARDAQVKEFEAQIKAYQAETQRISATAAAMTPEQISEIVLGTLHSAIASGDIVGQLPGVELGEGSEMALNGPQSGFEQQPMGMPQ